MKAPLKQPPSKPTLPEKVTLVDFFAYLPRHEYLFGVNGSLWPASSINAILPKVPLLKPDGTPVLDGKGKPKLMTPSTWLDKYRGVHGVTWAPGEPQVILHKLADAGGWIERKGVATFNLYKLPPPRVKGNPKGAKRWHDLLRRVYPDHVDHVTGFLAHLCQKPGIKVNHGLVLAGPPGVGKDSLLEPLRRGVGEWNYKEISPTDVTDRYNDYMSAVLLRISEARDLGDVNRYAFYERTKTILATPPDTMRINSKYVPHHFLFNVAGTIFTTNYPTDGLFLPQDDRRHYVCGTDVGAGDFEKEDPEFWPSFWAWYAAGGIDDVIAYLTQFNLSKFDPKKPPEKTAAFWRMADSGVAPEVPEMRDALDVISRRMISRAAVKAEETKRDKDCACTPDEKKKCNFCTSDERKKIGQDAIDAAVKAGTFGPPEVATIGMVLSAAVGGADLHEWLTDRRNRRAIPHRFEACGYTPVRNKSRADGLWIINGKRNTVYGRRNVALDRLAEAAKKLEEEKEKTGMEALKDIIADQ